MKIMLKILLIGICCFSICGTATALRIADFYQEVHVGEWIVLESSDGLMTKTEVLSKNNGLITLRIQSRMNGELVADSKQVFDVLQGKIKSIFLKTEFGIKEINPTETDFEDLFHIDFDLINEETITLDDKVYHCDVYRAVFNDRIVKVWIDDRVPVLHLVQIKMQHGWVRIVEYGIRAASSNKDNKDQ